MGGLIGFFTYKTGTEIIVPPKRDFFSLSAVDLHGNTIDFARYKGVVKGFLIINIACNCGYSSGQHDEMVKLYNKYKDRGFIILSFHCNQFNLKDPTDSKVILEIVGKKHGVTFPMFATVNVNLPNVHPVYRFLRINSELAKDGITKVIPWNFTKFLVNRDGKVVGFYPPSVYPFELEGEIIKLIS